MGQAARGDGEESHIRGPAGTSLVSQSLAFFLEEPPMKSSLVRMWIGGLDLEQLFGTMR